MWEQLITQYGYLAIFVGSLLEGETVLILAGIAAHKGYLDFLLVVLLAVCGGVIGDQTFFLLGRYCGGWLLTRYPSIATKVAPASRKIERHKVGFILGVRFMYGLRIAGPVVIGMSKVNFGEFLVLNIVGAIFWACLTAGAGYVFGAGLASLGVRHYLHLVIPIVILLVLGVAAYRWFKASKRR
jgi:membrane protein DedA with SNARE-associated domain